jgi:DtxR family Mn-dependent transcriptional regulator
VTLTSPGEAIARSIVRRHRLAEMLLTQVLALGEEITEATACQVEHILSAEVTDSVCAFLGHPPLCPHGKPIPRGDCCDLFRKEVQPLIVPLMDLRPGASGKVAFIRSLTPGRLDRVGTLGLVPGAVLRLSQRRPAVVVEIGHTTLALDREIADTVYVRPLPKGPTGI